MKKIASIFLALVMVLALLPTVASANTAVTVTINGQAVAFADQGPVIVNGRTLVPVAGVFQALGFEVQWHPNTRQVSIDRDSDAILLTIGSRTFTTNDVSHTLDVPAQIIGSRTMLPIAIVLRSVGYEVDWNNTTRTVIITSGGQSTPPIVNETEPTNVHPFAYALADFFENVTEAPEWALVPGASHVMTDSTHAVLVDVDGNGTPGVVASKWTANVQRYLPGSSAESILAQRLFLISNNQVRQITLDNMAVSSTGRLLTISGVDGQGVSMRAYTLLGFNNEQLTPIKSVVRTRYGYWYYDGVQESWVSSGEENSYFVNYHTNEFWNRNAEQDQEITYAEFNELISEYGLLVFGYGALGGNAIVWDIADQTNTILSMTTN